MIRRIPNPYPPKPGAHPTKSVRLHWRAQTARHGLPQQLMSDLNTSDNQTESNTLFQSTPPLVAAQFNAKARKTKIFAVSSYF